MLFLVVIVAQASFHYYFMIHVYLNYSTMYCTSTGIIVLLFSFLSLSPLFLPLSLFPPFSLSLLLSLFFYMYLSSLFPSPISFSSSLSLLLSLSLFFVYSIVPTAFIGTCVVFACLSMASLLSERRSYLFLAGKMTAIVMVYYYSILRVSMKLPSVIHCSCTLYLGHRWDRSKCSHYSAHTITVLISEIPVACVANFGIP